MEQLLLFENDTKLRIKAVEYFLSVSLDEHTSRQIKLLKNKLNAMIGLSKNNIESVPHISLLSAILPENDIHTISIIQDALLTQKCFTTKIKGVDIFVHGKTSKSLVLEFETPEPFNKLYQSLALALSCKIHSFNPHITIAKQIPIASFEQIPSLSDLEYQGDIVCQKITLLKKVNYRDASSKYARVKEFSLQ